MRRGGTDGGRGPAAYAQRTGQGSGCLVRQDPPAPFGLQGLRFSRSLVSPAGRLGAIGPTGFWAALRGEGAGGWGGGWGWRGPVPAALPLSARVYDEARPKPRVEERSRRRRAYRSSTGAARARGREGGRRRPSLLPPADRRQRRFFSLRPLVALSSPLRYEALAARPGTSIRRASKLDAGRDVDEPGPQPAALNGGRHRRAAGVADRGGRARQGPRAGADQRL